MKPSLAAAAGPAPVATLAPGEFAPTSSGQIVTV